MAVRVPPEVKEFARQVGDFIEYWGFKNVQGRIWAHLYLSDKPLDAGELMDRLKISKALVSISVREMLDYEVILECGKSERGTTLYKANPDQYSVIMNVLRRRERMMLSKIASAHKLCFQISEKEKSGIHLSDEGLQKVGEMISQAEGFLDAILHMDVPASEVWASLAMGVDPKSPDKKLNG